MKKYCLTVLLGFISLNLCLAKDKNPLNKLNIYFKTTDCVKCYNNLPYLDELRQHCNIEVVVNPEDEDYSREILRTRKVEDKSYTLRYATDAEKQQFNKAWSEYVLRMNGITYYGNYALLAFIQDKLDSLDKARPMKPELVSSQPGQVGALAPFVRSAQGTYIFEEKLQRLYTEIHGQGNEMPASDYFNTDSTYRIYKILPDYKALYYKFQKEADLPGSSIYSMTSYRGQPVFTGAFTSALTPLYAAKKRDFIIAYRDNILNSKDYSYIDGSSKFTPDVSYGVGIDGYADSLRQFYAFAWPQKKYSDSFIVASYKYSPKDTTWHQEQVYILDTTLKGFDYLENIAFIGSGYAVHASLPYLYSFPSVERRDLSTVLSLAFKMPIQAGQRLPKHHSLGKLWSSGSLVKILLLTNDAGNALNMLSYYPQYGIYAIAPIAMDAPPSRFRNMNYDEDGHLQLLYQSGKEHQVWEVK